MRLATRMTIAIGGAAVLLFGAEGLLDLQEEESALKEVAARETQLLGRALQKAFRDAIRDRQIEDVAATLAALTSVEPTVAIFVYDEQGRLIGEYDAAGAVRQELVYLGETPVASVRPLEMGGIEIFPIYTDHLNTPRLITDSADRTVWEWPLDAFGAVAANENPSALGAFSFNLRFPGQYYDAETGLHYNYFRDYDPSVGRYVESDPIGLKGGLNTYSYANSAPIGLIDPQGLDVVVTYYPGPIVDHKGIGVNSLDTYGFYPRERNVNVILCRYVPGRVSNDRYVQDASSQRKSQSIVIKTSPAQDNLVRQVIDGARNAGALSESALTYNLCSDQCTRFVIDALAWGGIALPRFDSALPKDLFDLLQQTLGQRR